MDIFDAVNKSDLVALENLILSGVDLAATDVHGLTALHRAAICCGRLPGVTCCEMFGMLIKAGAPLETLSRDRRTVLYMAAELSNYVRPVKQLIDAGAKVDIRDDFGNHVVDNCFDDEIRQLLISLTGYQPAIPEKAPFDAVSLGSSKWRTVKKMDLLTVASSFKIKEVRLQASKVFLLLHQARP
jgi:ankyrin repeat protein